MTTAHCIVGHTISISHALFMARVRKSQASAQTEDVAFHDPHQTDTAKVLVLPQSRRAVSQEYLLVTGIWVRNYLYPFAYQLRI